MFSSFLFSAFAFSAVDDLKPNLVVKVSFVNRICLSVFCRKGDEGRRRERESIGTSERDRAVPVPVPVPVPPIAIGSIGSSQQRFSKQQQFEVWLVVHGQKQNTSKSRSAES
jgi:hypothetical protein